MNAVFRHLAVRLWATAFLGIMTSLVLLPWWQRIAGIHWLPFAVGMVLVLLFVAAGWMMNLLGLFFLTGILREAAVWDRSGMKAEARAAFERGVAMFDSFWFSGRQRRRQSRLLTARLARFYLSQPALGGRERALVQQHLHRHPRDEDLALAWLTWLQGVKKPLAAEHETVDRIQETSFGHPKIRQSLLHFYLAHGRTDFNALQTYEKIWLDQALQDTDQIKSVARLLLSEERLADWVLAIYLQAYEAGLTDSLAGIVAGADKLAATPDNRSILDQAGQIASQLPADQREELAQHFQTTGTPPAGEKAQPESPHRFSALQKKAVEGLRVGAHTFSRFLKTLPGLAGQWSERWRESALMRRTVIAGAVGISLAVVFFAGWRFMGVQPEAEVAPQPPSVAEVPAAPADPFTIQVAAYLKAEDAQRFVSKLKDNGLDAFWNEATSAHRKWFQVKVSHFATKAAAQGYAEQLKAKGLIDDFYVANYTPPPPGQP